MKLKNVINFAIATVVFSCCVLLGLKLLHSNMSFDSLLRYVSRGVFGKEAVTGGVNMFYNGFHLHLLVSIIWVASLFIVYPNFKFKFPNWINAGLTFGSVVFFIMNFGVVPIAITKDFPTDPIFLIKSLAMNILTALPLTYYYVELVYKKTLTTMKD
jgi:hypothetical protein